jgi:hypothetical protein
VVNATREILFLTKHRIAVLFTGETLRSIGRSYNVSPQTISRLTA